MDFPASSRDGTGGSSGRPITRYGTTKYDPKEVSNHFYGDGPWHGAYRNRSRSTSPRHCFDRDGLNEGIIDQRGLGNSSDDHAVCDNRYKAQSNSEVSVFEPRGTTVHGAIIEGSKSLTGIQLLKLNRSFRKPDVLDTARSEASLSSCQCLRSSEQISILINILAQILEEIEQLPELYAALSSTSALKFLQSYVSGFAGPDASAASSTQLDLINHSLELIKSVVSEQKDGIALTSQLLLNGGPGGDGLAKTDYKKAELIVNSLQSSKKALSADCENEEPSILKAVEMREENVGGELANYEGDGSAAEIKKNSDAKNLQTSEKAAFSDCKNKKHSIVNIEVINKEQVSGKLVNSEGEDKADEIKNNDGKSLHDFKISLVKFVKKLLDPTWKEGEINKEAYKIIVKNVVDEVIASIQSIHIPKTKEKIDNYLFASKPKILKLLQAYITKEKKQAEQKEM